MPLHFPLCLLTCQPEALADHYCCVHLSTSYWGSSFQIPNSTLYDFPIAIADTYCI